MNTPHRARQAVIDHFRAEMQPARSPLSQLQTAQGAWVLMLEAARRVGHLARSLGKDSSPDLCSALEDAALSSLEILDQYYESVAPNDETDRQINDAMAELATLAALAATLRTRPAHMRGDTITRELLAAIYPPLLSLERRVGREWNVADPAAPERWAAAE